MTTSVDDILARFLRRKAAQGPMARRMREVRDTYNGDIVVPLPELESSERSAVPNLTAMGLDQMGTRIASVMPDPRFTPRRAGDAELVRCKDRRLATLGWWEFNRLNLKMYRRGRWFLGYGSAPVLIRPDFETNAPRWELKDPLGCYPAPMADPDSAYVDDAIFAVKRSLGWLQRRYPAAAANLSKDRHDNKDAQVEVLEYVDHDELVICVVGPGSDNEANYDSFGYVGPHTRVEELERIENRAGVCTAVVPGRINLDRRQSQFDSMIGMHQMRARLMALEVIAVEKGIFPDEWLVADAAGNTPQIIKEADGRRGVVGMVKGGTLRAQPLNPGYQTFPTIDRIERAERLNGGIPAEFGGESGSNIRTGRRGENVLSATIDFTIQEAQQIFAVALEIENKAAIAVDKGYHNVDKSFYVSWQATKGEVKYKPSELFETDQHVVSYAQAGSDVNSLVIGGGQRIAQQTMSKLSFMQIDPMIDNPEVEHDRIVIEALESAYLSSVQQRAAQGELPEVDLIRVMQLVGDDKMDLAKAVLKAQEEAQARQAEAVPVGDPMAQPGMATPGMGAEAPEVIGEVEPSIQHLSQTLSALRRPQMPLRSEGPLPQAAV